MAALIPRGLRAALCLSCAAATIAGPLFAQEPQAVLHAGFGDGWSARWIEARLAPRATTFTAVTAGGDRVLRADSDRSAAALYHPLELTPAPGQTGLVSWRWKVQGPIEGNTRERQKRGDDYAARFFVVFDAEPFSREARALCYVWASSELPGATYPNPYFREVRTVVLRSGDQLAGQWVAEQRDFLDDYRETYGGSPEAVTAVAVMADTDDTGGRATAWFDDIVLRLSADEGAHFKPRFPERR